MDTALTLVGSGLVAVFSAAATTSLRLRSERQQKRAEHINELLARYREPIVRAAFELQSRLYNIVVMSFLEYLANDDDRGSREYGIRSTQWLVGQYLGWVEVLRREVQFLDMGSVERNRELVRLQDAVSAAFATERETLAESFQILRADQRAIGELMTAPSADHERPTCLGYAGFLRHMADDDDPFFRARFALLERDIDAICGGADQRRLVEIQRALIDLIEFLDADQSRVWPDSRSKLPLEPAAG